MARFTKIVATIGPASLDEKTLQQMYVNGMSVARINTAHGDTTQYKDIIQKVRAVSSDIPIMLDLKGPEVRIALGVGEITVNTGETFEVGREGEHENNFTLDVMDELEVGHRIRFADARYDGKIVKKEGATVTIEMVNGGTIKSLKGVNLPDMRLDFPSLSEKDHTFLPFIKEQGIELVALSFVQNHQAVADLRQLVGDEVQIISKIENQHGIDDLEAIAKLSDGVMVARGGLGGELGLEEVPYAQKRIIRTCLENSCPVITATEMLDSMIDRSHPTRAEVTDVANAILDGSDAVMLSGETAMGQDPARAVEEMSAIAARAEKRMFEKDCEFVMEDRDYEGAEPEFIAGELAHIAKRLRDVKVVVVLTSSGYTAKALSRYKLPAQIVAFSDHPATKPRLAYSWGVRSVILDRIPESGEFADIAKGKLLEMGVIKPGDRFIWSAGFPYEEIKVSRRMGIEVVE